MDIGEEYVDLSTQGATCVKIIEKQVNDVFADKENIKGIRESRRKQLKIRTKREPTKKKVLTDKNEDEVINTKEQKKYDVEESQPSNQRRVFETTAMFQNMLYSM
ncbi:hypothetical protein FQA39_LY14489 [Lamprigera yunnana]|nr:hypothetical protein FQA39_LY14489 [Lamprigera yunnana]